MVLALGNQGLFQMRSLLAIVVAGVLFVAGPALAQSAANSGTMAKGDQAMSSAANGSGHDSADDSEDGLSAYDQTNSFPCVNSVGETAVCALVAGTIVVIAVLANNAHDNNETTSTTPVSVP